MNARRRLARYAQLCCLGVLVWGVAVADDEGPPLPLSRPDVIADAVRSVPMELADIALYPLHHPRAFLTGAAIVGGLILVDKPVTKAYQDHVETPLAGFHLPTPPSAVTRLGPAGADAWLALGVGATSLAGLALDDPRLESAGLGSLRAATYSVLVTQVVLKSLSGRMRPLPSLSAGAPDATYTDNPYDFFNHRVPTARSDATGSSFPSFHFTLYFAIARVYARTYDNTLWPYALATVGLASNIRSHHHWVSDMVGGALVGTAIGDSIELGPKDRAGRQARLEPSLHEGVPSIDLIYRF